MNDITLPTRSHPRTVTNEVQPTVGNSTAGRSPSEDLDQTLSNFTPVPDCPCALIAQDRRLRQHAGGLERVVMIIDVQTHSVDQITTAIDRLDPGMSELRIVTGQHAERRGWLRRVLPLSASDRRRQQFLMNHAVRAAQLRGFVASGWMQLDHFGQLANALGQTERFHRAVLLTANVPSARRDRPARALAKARIRPIDRA